MPWRHQWSFRRGTYPTLRDHLLRGRVEGLELSGDVRTAGCVDDFLHTMFAQLGQPGSDVVSLCDRGGESVAVVEQHIVALGEVGDMPFMGQQMTLVRRSEFLDRLPPGSSPGHRIHGRGPSDRVRLVIGHHFPRADRLSYPLTVRLLAGVEDGACQQGRCGQRVPDRTTDDSVGYLSGKFDTSRPEDAQPDLNIDG